MEKKLEKKVGTLKKHGHKINIATFGDLWRPLDPAGHSGSSTCERRRRELEELREDAMPGLTAKYLRTAPARSRDPANVNEDAHSVSSEGSAQDEQQTVFHENVKRPSGTPLRRPSWRAAWSFLESR